MTSNSNNRLKEIDNVQQDVERTLRSDRMKWNEFTKCDNDQLFCVRCIPMWMYLSFSLCAHVSTAVYQLYDDCECRLGDNKWKIMFLNHFERIKHIDARLNFHYPMKIKTNIMQIEIGKKGKMNNAINDRQQQPYQHQCQRKKQTHIARKQ